jgi:hypothetical protein
LQIDNLEKLSFVHKIGLVILNKDGPKSMVNLVEELEEEFERAFEEEFNCLMYMISIGATLLPLNFLSIVLCK